MHWLAVHLPSLPLDLLLRRGFDAYQPLAVTDGEGPRPQIVMANSAAMQRGVRSGQTLPAARALAPELEAHPRDRDEEAAAMQRMAACAYGFSSLVSLDEHTVRLEIGASLRLFGGVSALRKHFIKSIKILDLTATLSSAPTPSAAGLLARCGVDADVGEGELQRILGNLPLERTPLPADTLEALRGAGLRSVGDLARLPRAGLARRYSRAVTDWLDRLFGHVAEPLPAWQPPPRFAARIELPSEVDNSEALRFPLRRLIAELVTFLAGRDGGVERFELMFEHHDRVTRAAVGLLAPSRDAAVLIEMAEGRLARISHHPPTADADTLAVARAAPSAGLDVASTTPLPVFSPRRAPQRHLDALATERGEKCGLARISLPAPVHAIAVEAADLPPLLPEARDLFSTRSTPALPLPRLIERLCARLGEDAVCGIEALADHRPERAWRRDSSPSPGGRGPFDAAQGSVAERGRPKRNVASGSDLLPQPLSRRERGAMAMPERPLWLLERPEPVRSGSFQVLSGPERIESGWWDDGEVRRDYYIARDAAGRRCWLFRDRGGWFLQGLFG